MALKKNLLRSNKYIAIPLVILATLLVVLASSIGFYFGQKFNADKNAVLSPTPFLSEPTIDNVCTMEALLCPDGSSVGRTGPNCEFTPCPGQAVNPSVQPSQIVIGTCKRTGCSGELCIDSAQEDINTTCIFREDFACLQKALCQRQASGECGFTQTSESQACLDAIPTQ